MKNDELTEKIIGCAYKVYNTMGFGYLESVYEKCFIIELEKANFSVESQCPIKVFYEGENVGLVINFGPEHVKIKRKSKTLLKQSC